MEKLDETKAAINSVEGLLKFLGGGNMDIENMPFGVVIDSILRNGGSVSFNVTRLKQCNPTEFQNSIEY